MSDSTFVCFGVLYIDETEQFIFALFWKLPSVAIIFSGWSFAHKILTSLSVW